MNILVITGSPKGEKSVTLQYARWLQKRFPGHEWEWVHAAAHIAGLEKDEQRFARVMDQVRRADLVLWTFPLYVLLVHAGLKRFIELAHERGAGSAFAGKYAASLSTSIHFHDNCAHDYIQGVSEDMGMRFVEAHAAAMEDLNTEKGRRSLEGFGRLILAAAAEKRAVFRRFSPLVSPAWSYAPCPISGDDAPADLRGKRAALVHDGARPGSNLALMVERLAASFMGQVAVHDLSRVDMRANCLGCLRCAMHSRCVQEERDEFAAWYRRELMDADIIVLAGNMKDRHLSSRWRRFFERGFFSTHIPTLKGKQLAFLVAGPASQCPPLQQSLRGWTLWQEASLAGIVSDERGDGAELDAVLSGLARRLADGAIQGYVPPVDYMGQGGRLIFRDHIYGPLRYVFQADHKYFKRNGYYDFPTRNWRQRIINALLTLLFKIPAARRAFESRMKDEMVKPVRRQVEALEQGRGTRA